MGGWSIFGIVIGALIVLGIVFVVATNLGDIRRYLRIRSM